MKVEITPEKYAVALLRANPDKIYVFGCNLIRKGKGGQAVVRDEPNAFGIPTKRLPSMNDCAYFSDKDDEKEAVLVELRKLYVLCSKHTIVFPQGGLGTGLARMQEKSPKIFEMMNKILLNFFDFDNLNFIQ